MLGESWYLLILDDKREPNADARPVAAREGVVLLDARALMQIPTVQELEQLLPDVAGGEVPK